MAPFPSNFAIVTNVLQTSSTTFRVFFDRVVTASSALGFDGLIILNEDGTWHNASGVSQVDTVSISWEDNTALYLVSGYGWTTNGNAGLLSPGMTIKAGSYGVTP